MSAHILTFPLVPARGPQLAVDALAMARFIVTSPEAESEAFWVAHDVLAESPYRRDQMLAEDVAARRHMELLPDNPKAVSTVRSGRSGAGVTTCTSLFLILLCSVALIRMAVIAGSGMPQVLEQAAQDSAAKAGGW